MQGFVLIGCPAALVGCPAALIRCPAALIGCPAALIGCPAAPGTGSASLLLAVQPDSLPSRHTAAQ